MSKPSKVEALFMPVFLEMDMLIELGRQIRFKETPYTFVTFFLELMRSQVDADRQAATAFLTYMRGRSWPEALEMLSRYAGPEEMKDFREPNAEKFFTDFMLIAQQQVQDYLEQFMEQRKNTPPKAMNPGDYPALVSASGDERAALVNEIVQTVVGEIKKFMDAGEDWKKGTGDDMPA